MGFLDHQVEALRLLRELDFNRSARTSSEQNQTSAPATPVAPIAVRARRSLFSRLVEILSQIISIEKEFMRSSPGEGKCFLRHKDSVDLKNICLRMALSGSDFDTDRNLKELRLCLHLIVHNLLSAVRTQNHLWSTGATRRLMGISVTLPDI